MIAWEHSATADALAEYLMATRRTINLLELDFARAASQFAALPPNQHVDIDTDAVQWMREACRMTSHAAQVAIEVGDAEPQLMQTIAALTDGSIGIAHLGWMADTARRLATSKSSELPFDETKLLRKAKKLSVQRFRRECQHVLHASDHAAFVDEQVHGVEARRLRLSTYDDGSVHIDAFLDPEGGAIVRAAIDPFAKSSGPKEYRSVPQRRADALVEICNHILDTGEASRHGGERPHIHVTTTLETLLDFTGAPAAATESGALLSGTSVERLGCDSTMIRVLLDTDSMVVDVGRAARVVPPATRRALHVRDGGCVWPGCERSASWTQAHHLTHWAVGGRTDLQNLVLLCHRHHWMVHEGGWTIARTNEGEIVTLAAFPEFHGRDPTFLAA